MVSLEYDARYINVYVGCYDSRYGFCYAKTFIGDPIFDETDGSNYHYVFYFDGYVG